MRCHFSEKNEDTSKDTTSLSIWASADVQSPNTLETVDSHIANCQDVNSFHEDLSTLCCVDSVSQSYKRKILECEREDFEERFSKIQRRRQIRASMKSDLVVEDDFCYDEEAFCEQMDWIGEDRNPMPVHLFNNSNVDLPVENMNPISPFLYIPKFKWREERRHLLRISMAKIRGVEDPETYLRRSVLINNTVKRLQKDVSLACKNHPVTSTYGSQECFTYPNKSNYWETSNDNDTFRTNYPDSSVDFGYTTSLSDDGSGTQFTFSNLETSYDYLPLSCSYPSNKPVDMVQTDSLNDAFTNKSLVEDSRLQDTSVSSRTVKHSTVQFFSSQPCGLQYRNPSPDDTNCEYEFSHKSSLLDSVVYHSLIASLET